MIHFVISFRRFNRWTQLQYAIQLIRIFSSVKTVVVCSYLIKYIDSFYCRIIFLMCCLFSFPFANSNSYHSSSVGFDYTVLPDCFNIDFPIWDKNIRTLLNLPWMRVYRSIRVFFFLRLCSYLISSRIVTFILSFGSNLVFFLSFTLLSSDYLRFLPHSLAFVFNYYHILYSVSYVFFSPAAFLILVLQLF